MPKIVDHGERKKDLARAVWAVVERDGVEGATIRAVAAEAGWTRGVIAHYFRDRDDLLLFAYRLALQREQELGPGPDIPPLERLVGVLLRALPVDAQARLDFKIWLAFMGRVADHPALAKAVLENHRDYHLRIRELVRSCSEAGVLFPPWEVDRAAAILATFVDGLGIMTALDPATYTPDRLGYEIRTFLGSWSPDGTGTQGSPPERRDSASA
ncbi:TetR family transcriptional regulator C-terminal domain-containing protein [Streptomyces sp. NPDC091215]|uniref:TetR/AcrR family transcriptional regulator n=1 Tax=Streptomyces sp. NPDC091215 TaxID=3155192 RepID=UPI0034475326